MQVECHDAERLYGVLGLFSHSLKCSQHKSCFSDTDEEYCQSKRKSQHPPERVREMQRLIAGPCQHY